MRRRLSRSALTSHAIRVVPGQFECECRRLISFFTNLISLLIAQALPVILSSNTSRLPQAARSAFSHCLSRSCTICHYFRLQTPEYYNKMAFYLSVLFRGGTTIDFSKRFHARVCKIWSVCRDCFFGRGLP